jgi:hypothetical protein
VCKEGNPVFHATSAEASNFTGQNTTWVTVINKCVRHGRKVPYFLQKLSLASLLSCHFLDYETFTSCKQRSGRMREHKDENKSKFNSARKTSYSTNFCLRL